MRRILFVCTGNSCRSPMAAGLLKSWHKGLGIYSAGIRPEEKVSRFAVEVMLETGIDISSHQPKHLDDAIIVRPDIIVTLSPSARLKVEGLNNPGWECIHIEVEDPMEIEGTDEFIRKAYRATRDELAEKLKILFPGNDM